MEIYIFIIYQETPGRMAFRLQSENNPALTSVSQKCWWITTDLASLQSPSSQILLELPKKQGLNVAILIPGDILTAFEHIPKKHIIPQNFYQDFSFSIIFPRKSSHTLLSHTQTTILVVLLFTAAWKWEAEYGGVVSNKKQRTLWGQHQ